MRPTIELNQYRLFRPQSLRTASQPTIVLAMIATIISAAIANGCTSARHNVLGELAAAETQLHAYMTAPTSSGPRYSADNGKNRRIDCMAHQARRQPRRSSRCDKMAHGRSLQLRLRFACMYARCRPRKRLASASIGR